MLGRRSSDLAAEERENGGNVVSEVPSVVVESVRKGHDSNLESEVG